MDKTGEWKLGHRPALDGIRGVAVLLVVAAHAQVTGFGSGGLVGVTLFFVLSGFLITTLLLEEVDERGHISLGAFYVRRGLRLLPALVALVAVVLLVAQALGPEVATSGDAAWALLYVGNWVRAAGGDLGALSHVWSLAIEEQFYVLWPLLVMAFARRRGVLAGAAVSGAVVAVTLRVALWDQGRGLERVYFGSDTRADAILLGCALAVAIRHIPVLPRQAATVALVGAAALSVSSGGFAYVWVPLLAAALGAVAVAVAAAGRGDGGWLSARWLVAVGRRSYGLYLWHVPIFLFLLDSYRLDPLPWAARIVLLSAMTWAATWASYRFVELPALAYKRRWEQSRSERQAARVIQPGYGVTSRER